MWLFFALVGFLIQLTLVVLVVLWGLQTPDVSTGGHPNAAYRQGAAGLTVLGTVLNLAAIVAGSAALQSFAGLLFLAGVVMVVLALMRRMFVVLLSPSH
jgi:hypothetical protein